MLLIVVLWTIPSIGLFVSSFLPASDATTTGWWTAFFHPFTTDWTLDNYCNVLGRGGMFDAFINSLIVTIPSTVIPITLAAFAAYAFAWVKFRGRAFLFAVVVGLLVVPLQMSLVPLLRIYQATGLTGSFLGIWLAHTGFGLPLAIYLLYNYISQLPKDIFESAYIDGATPFTAFTRLVLPLSLPALASFAIFQFLWVWNDFLVALVFLGTNDRRGGADRSSSRHWPEPGARRSTCSPPPGSSRCSLPMIVFLAPAAVLRAWASRRLGQGMRPALA